MAPSEKQVYVVGFAFDRYGRVVLIQKNRPEWQAGKLNGVGGHVEEGEPPYGAMVREFHEETGVCLTGWQEFVRMEFPLGRIHFFRILGLEPHVLSSVRTTTDEEVRLATPPLLGERLIPNLRWLLPLAQYAEDDYELIHVKARHE